MGYLGRREGVIGFAALAPKPTRPQPKRIWPKGIFEEWDMMQRLQYVFVNSCNLKDLVLTGQR